MYIGTLQKHVLEQQKTSSEGQIYAQMSGTINVYYAPTYAQIV